MANKWPLPLHWAGGKPLPEEIKTQSYGTYQAPTCWFYFIYGSKNAFIYRSQIPLVRFCQA